MWRSDVPFEARPLRSPERITDVHHMSPDDWTFVFLFLGTFTPGLFLFGVIYCLVKPAPKRKDGRLQ